MGKQEGAELRIYEASTTCWILPFCVLFSAHLTPWASGVLISPARMLVLEKLVLALGHSGVWVELRTSYLQSLCS